jgi:ATP-binding cassette, subfamily B, bacterial
MKILYTYLKRHWGLLALALVLAAINQSFSMMDPAIQSVMVDKYIVGAKSFISNSPAFYHGVLYYLGLLIGVAFISRIAKNFQDYYTNVIIQKTGAKIYTDGLAHSLELPYQVFEDQRSGETLGILQKVRQDTERLITAAVSVLFTTLVGITFVIVKAIQINWLIIPIFFSVIPILSILSLVMSKRIKKIQKVIVAETTALAGSTTESLRNIELVKSLGLSSQEINRLNTTTIKILGLELKKVRFIRSLSFVQGTVINLLRVTIMFLMMYLVFHAKLTVGQYYMFIFYSFFIFGPLQELGNIINVYREAQVSLNNFDKIMNTPAEPRPEKPVKIASVHDLEFKHITFRHLSASQDALTDINFKVGKGETIAFVGPSGAGKSTLVKLLVGLYLPKQGDILYNGNSVHNIDLDGLRERIGFVTQDSQLFSGSIRENLLFVKPGATDDEIWAVLKRSSLDSLLTRADKGLDTLIGENGIKVSGGEKQRLSIARAILRNPDLMVFDEATSSLDSITEEGISNTIRQITSTGNVITIMIAHRLSTIMHSDRIYVLERGQVIEVGKHQELLNDKGLYYAMWRQQIGERVSMNGNGEMKKATVLTTN